MGEVMFDYYPTKEDILKAAKFCSSTHQYCDGCIWHELHDDGLACEEEFASYIQKAERN